MRLEDIEAQIERGTLEGTYPVILDLIARVRKAEGMIAQARTQLEMGKPSVSMLRSILDVRDSGKGT